MSAHEHHPACIDRAVWTIAENNGWTLADDPATPARNLTPETEDEAREWLANGNAECTDDRCAGIAESEPEL